MAKLSAHGRELWRADKVTYRLAYMADRHILKDTGGGWKLWRRVKDDVDLERHVADAKKRYEERSGAVRVYRDLMLSKFKSLATRRRVVFEMEGCHADPQKTFEGLTRHSWDSVNTTLEEITLVCAAHKAAVEQVVEARGE